MVLLRRDPTRYLPILFASYVKYTQSPTRLSQFHYFRRNASQIPLMEKLWTVGVYGQFHGAAIWMFFALPFIILWGYYYAWRERGDFARSLTALFMALTLTYTTFVGIVFEFAENNRFRFNVEPFILILTVLAVHKAARTFMTVKQRRAGRRGQEKTCLR